MEFASLCISFFLILAGVKEYTTGFFLTRYEITEKSEVFDSQPKEQYGKIVVLLVDALRYDFVYPSNSSFAYANNLEIMQALLKSYPNNTVLMEFISDPPTVTMQRIKGMTTGSLPTFIDFKDNLQSDSIQEDNILYQLKLQKKKSLFVGDMIWLCLLPDGFTQAYPYDSHNVRDLDTVDNGVLYHFRKELGENWDLIIGHMLGVDHAGHRYHVNHPEMKRKLLEVNGFIEEIVNGMDENTLLIVIGDHGMTDQGNHGGDTVEERNTILFAYSKKKFLDLQRRKRIPQIDIVPTLSILLGVGIPYNNLGAVIPELFTDNSAVETSIYLNTLQISRYLNKYDRFAKKLPDAIYEDLQTEFLIIEKKHAEGVLTAEEGLKYIYRASEMCRDIWTNFDLELMSKGLGVVFITTIALVFILFFQVDFSGITVNALVTLVILIFSPVVASLYWLWYIGKNVVTWSMSQDHLFILTFYSLHGYTLFSDSYILKQDQTIRFLLQGILAYVARKGYSHELLYCAICVRLSASIDLLIVTNEINQGNFMYNDATLSWIPLLILIYYSNNIGRVNFLITFIYWYIEPSQLLPKLVYGWTLLTISIHWIYKIKQKTSIWIHQGCYWNLFGVLTLISGQYSPIILLCALSQLYFSYKSINQPQILGTFIGFSALQYFYTTGHKCNIQSLIIPSAFIGFEEYQWLISGVLLTLNTCAGLFIILWTGHVDGKVKCIKGCMGFFLGNLICTMMNTGINRRHLMTWSVFAPKYIYDGTMFVLTWGVSLLILATSKEKTSKTM